MDFSFQAHTLLTCTPNRILPAAIRDSFHGVGHSSQPPHHAPAPLTLPPRPERSPRPVDSCRVHDRQPSSPFHDVHARCSTAVLDCTAVWADDARGRQRRAGPTHRGILALLFNRKGKAWCSRCCAPRSLVAENIRKNETKHFETLKTEKTRDARLRRAAQANSCMRQAKEGERAFQAGFSREQTTSERIAIGRCCVCETTIDGDATATRAKKSANKAHAPISGISPTLDCGAMRALAAESVSSCPDRSF